MNINHPEPHAELRDYPCPSCRTLIAIKVVETIGSHEELEAFISFQLNRGTCSNCGHWMEAPVRVSAKSTGDEYPEVECIPVPMLEYRDVLDQIVQDTRPHIHRVYSCGELERAVFALSLIELHRQGIDPYGE